MDRISVHLTPNELTLVAVHKRLVYVALALILHLVDVSERFDGFCVIFSCLIHNIFCMINRLMNVIHADHRFNSLALS